MGAVASPRGEAARTESIAGRERSAGRVAANAGVQPKGQRRRKEVDGLENVEKRTQKKRRRRVRRRVEGIFFFLE